MQWFSREIGRDLNAHAYRADIDGLRAVAVGMVVIFHAWPRYLPGGFVGVDIFFVISGFLITGLFFRNANREPLATWIFFPPTSPHRSRPVDCHHCLLTLVV
jgi:hypothetical protein